MDEKLRKRFWAKVHKTNDCWIWIGGKMTAGYGSFWVSPEHGKDGAHRVSYEMEYGPFDPDLFVLHNCDNKPCIRPSHLFLGTQVDNMQDCARKGGLRNAFRWTKENNPNKGKPMPDHLKKAMSEREQKPFRFIDPSGNLVEGINLSKFCRERGLNQGAMFSVSIHRGRVRSHKGYRRAP